MRKTCVQAVAGVMRSLWESRVVSTQRRQQFYNMGTTTRVMSSLSYFVPQSCTQLFLGINFGNRAFIPTFHRTNNEYNKGN